eukprot:CAMPEP_0173319920 /NCGR_PEP_ID=MMETSP1143-20121109/28513_1 /TAXON_ID=483371 /ORGANISM="non described non described, Strain CCMP2298" /LENGTH=118 /DNA_ID=CAMNT_0014263395 /DNA_START=230 /DNA_END=586 /DNA_ORIENTATION=-
MRKVAERMVGPAPPEPATFSTSDKPISRTILDARREEQPGQMPVEIMAVAPVLRASCCMGSALATRLSLMSSHTSTYCLPRERAVCRTRGEARPWKGPAVLTTTSHWSMARCRAGASV